MSLSDRHYSALPPVIVERLRAVIRRVRRIQLLKGGLATLAALVLAVLVAMGIDAAFSVDHKGVRLLLTAAVIATFVISLYHFLLRPLSKRISLAGVARWIEEHHPEMQERLSTSVELVGAAGQPGAHGSQDLLDEVVRDAISDAGHVNPKSELSARVARRPLITAAVALALLAMTVLFVENGWRLLRRIMQPLADAGNAWADDIRLLTKDQLLAEGEPLAIEAAVKVKDSRVELHMIAADGKETVETMNPDNGVSTEKGENGYAVRIPAATRGFRYYLTAGRAKSAIHEITVLPRPRVEDMEVTFDYPDYTGFPTETKPNHPGDLVALSGTQVTVKARLNRAVEKVEAFISNQQEAGREGTASGMVRTYTQPAADGTAQAWAEWKTTLTPGLDGTWSFSLSDSHGISGKPVDYPIRALPDSGPVITLQSPVESELLIQPTDKLPLAWTIKEDLGISAVRVILTPAGKPEIIVPMKDVTARGTGTPDVWSGRSVIDFAQQPLLADANELRLVVEAADTLPVEQQGPQTARSREILIRLRRDARPLMQQVFAAQAEQMRRDLQQAVRKVEEARNLVQDKPGQLAQQDTIHPNILKQIEDSQAKAEEAVEMLKAIAEEMKDTAYARQAEDVAQIAGQLVQPAAEKEAEIPLTDNREQRVELAREATEKLQQAAQMLNEEINQTNEDQRMAENAARLEALAEQQSQLARDAAETKKDAAEQAAEDARLLAEEAKSLAQRQTELAEKASSAQEPKEARETAQQQQKLAQEAAKLREKTEQFQRENAGELADDARQQQLARQAAEDTQRAVNDSQDAVQSGNRTSEQNAQLPQPPPGRDPQKAQQAAAAARELGQKAEALAQKQQELTRQAEQADTIGKQQALADAEQQIAGEAQQLQQQAEQLNQQHGGELWQDNALAQRAQQAVQDARDAQEDARQSSEAARQAAQENQQAQARAQQNQTPPETPGADNAAAAALEAAASQTELAQTAQNLNELAKGLEAAAAKAQEQQTAAQAAQAQGQQPPQQQPVAQGADDAQSSAQDARASAQELAQAAQQLDALADQLAAEAGMNPDAPVTEPSPRDAQLAQQAERHAQQIWQQQQGQVAGQAQDVANQLNQRNNEGMQKALQQGAEQAQQLAATAQELAKQQAALADQVAAARTPEAQQALVAQETSLAQQAEQLAQKTQELSRNAGQQIDQNTSAQEAAWSAARELQAGVQEAKAATQQLAQASQTPPAAEGQPSPQSQSADPASNSAQTPPGSDPAQAQAANAAPPASAEGASPSGTPADPATAANNAAAGESSSASPSDPASGADPAQATTPASEQASTPGQTAAEAAESSFTSAAQSLQSLSAAMSAQSLMLATEAKSMQEGAQLAQQASQQGSQQGPQNSAPSAGNAQQSAQDAAAAMQQAAAATMQSMGIPSSARQTAQTKPGQGKGKGKGKNPSEPSNEQSPDGEGQLSKSGIQPNGADGEIPPELAKLGLTPADWTKLKGLVSGLNSAESDKVPAEYRELVKAYFGALAKGQP